MQRSATFGVACGEIDTRKRGQRGREFDTALGNAVVQDRVILVVFGIYIQRMAARGGNTPVLLSQLLHSLNIAAPHLHSAGLCSGKHADDERCSRCATQRKACQRRGNARRKLTASHNALSASETANPSPFRCREGFRSTDPAAAAAAAATAGGMWLCSFHCSVLFVVSLQFRAVDFARGLAKIKFV